jgi:DNA-directed RNA polymerase specialized sigma24 family protein
MELAMIENRVTVPAEPLAPLAIVSSTSSTYDSFVAEHRPRLLQVLVARFGIEVGADATADAMAYSFEHWDRVESMTNPLGYLFRVGQTSARKQFRWSRSFALPEPEPNRLPDVEPGLARALMKLDYEQRVMVMLVHGHDWSYAEVAAVFDVTVTKVRNELSSAMQKLRKQLGSADSVSGSKSAREQAAKPGTKQAVEQERGARL